MEKPELDDFMALNDQLAALVDAGVPLDVGLGRAGKDLPRTLEKINAVVARRVARGASLEEALDDKEEVPGRYRSMVLSGLRTSDMSGALDASNRVAESVDDSQYVAESSFFYPLVVCFLAYIGMVGFCLFFVPTLDSTYEGLEIEPGSGLVVLRWLRDTMAYWVAAPPIALLLFLAWRWRRRPRRAVSGSRAGWLLAWLPGVSRSLFQQRCASFAETLAALEVSGVPLEEGLPLAAGASGDPKLAEGARLLAGPIAKGDRPSDKCAGAKQFPPFLRWALLDSEATVGRAAALEMAARVYRESAERGAERSRIVAPLLVTVILGGGATLLYGLALFVPVVEMLKALASGS